MKTRIALLFAATAPLANACPLCRDSVPHAQSAGFNSSIGWMLGGMMVVVAMLVRQLVRFKD